MKTIKIMLNKVGMFIDEIITRIIIDSAFNGASSRTRFKWKVEDFFKGIFNK